MELELIADALISSGLVIGIAVKYQQVVDERTVISRRSSLLNIVTYPFTAIIPFMILGLYLSVLSSLISFSLWFMLFLFRAPEDESYIPFSFWSE